MSFISVRHVSRSFGSFDAVSDLSLDIEPGEFVTLVGPSGCGKSTLLQMIGGLLPANDGEIWLNGKRVTAPPRELVYVFQQYNRSLFPWRTVRRNVAFGLEDGDMSAKEIDRKCSEYIELVGLAKFDRYLPHQLSGGMQQRVAVARALAVGARVILMDEPFGSVDAQTRAGLQDLVLRLWQQYGLTILLVTHDIDEAIYMGQRVVVMSVAPARICTTLTTELPYPRDQIKTREIAQYLEYRRNLYSILFPKNGGSRT